METTIKKIKIKKRQDGKVGFLIGFLDKSVDATYIIHKAGNGRLDQVKEQLKMYQPTKTIYLVQTPGWKEKHELPENKHICSTLTDIVDNNIQIFKHANKREYRNILVLEDDFFFKEKILNKDVQEEINFFLKENQEKDMIYTLGCVPLMSFPFYWKSIFFNHYYTVFAGMHCCVFTKPYREKLLNKGDDYLKKILDWDYETFFGVMYHEPLCYQLFPETENKQNWGNYSVVAYIIVSFYKKLILLLQLDKKPEPGYTIAYVYSKIVVINIVAFLILLIGSLLVFLQVDLDFLRPEFPVAGNPGSPARPLL